MPRNSKTTETNKKNDKKAPVKKAAPAKAAPQKHETSLSKPKEKTQPNPDSVFNRVMPYILMIFALFVAVCFLLTDMTGSIGNAIRVLLYGLFSTAAWFVPVVIAVEAVCWKKDVERGEIGSKAVFALVVITFIAVLMHVHYVRTNGIPTSEVSFHIKELWTNGIGSETVSRVGGGVIGGLIAALLLRLIGIAGTLIVSIALLFTFTVFLFGLTPRALGVYIAYYLHEKREESKRKHAEETERLKPYYTPVRRDKGWDEPMEEPAAPEVPKESKKKKINDRIDTLEEPEDLPPFDIDVDPFAEKPEEEAPETLSPSDYTPASPITELIPMEEAHNALKEVFGEEGRKAVSSAVPASQASSLAEAVPDAAELELMVERKRLSEIEAEKEEAEKADQEEKEPVREYVFPPLSLLNIKNEPQNVDISDELHKNAVKLVETLASFKVRTRVVNVSRGPTVTRYELVPEEGIRVRSIANLVDDIALNLATTGVRIEAPIPGKSAVGIEVPNRIKETVYLRELIDKTAFKQAQSKLNVVLGKSVAGEPIYLDIAKMPHLLIAGATGMGKSVCINTMIISLLYKATPDEVKMILIGPKKVEFSMYNGIPHLLVPVVSDPKKAAGSLHWAVTEMERRFEMIEDVGVRDVMSYNKITENDPEKERLPQIVIVIDELADLMMTAPDDVEDSICRLAQKARAAGMHLVIGTQRPSVDVVTGLIKANVPSRIACTMASQVDSRTILDVAGAEKLIGKGDMLYSPVGFNKPMRVQGAFVSDPEVESVVQFLKSSCGSCEYNDDVMAQIDKEAARCGMGKKSGGGSVDIDDEDMDSDPMLGQALKLAVDSGKISTSLIQRKLSLGYGRAAKLIDKMQILGYVSPPEGQKPRTVLITKQQYMEMVLKQDDFV